MDEPSSGMDPGTRSLLRDIIKETVRCGQSVLLTSHSMAECDALCDRYGRKCLFISFHTDFRLAIMKTGEIICQGNPQELKAKEGDGYKVNVKIKQIEKKRDLDRFLLESFGNIKVGEVKDKWVNYKLNGNVSEMLGILATAKEQFELEGFTINLMSLEDVFLQVTQGIPNHYI